MNAPPVPKLTLFFSKDFGDSTWAEITYALEAPQKNRGEWVLGRSPTCDLTIDIRTVSTKHAIICYSYGANQWTLTDLSSHNGTFFNGHKLDPGKPVELKLRDKFMLGPGARIEVVEDEQDTISSDSVGPETVASTEPLDFRPVPQPPPEPEPPPARTLWDTVYYTAQWLFSGQTVAGKIYRVVMLVAGTIFIVLLIDLVKP